MAWDYLSALILVVAIGLMSSATFAFMVVALGWVAAKLKSPVAGFAALILATLSGLAAGGLIAYSALSSAVTVL